MKLRWTKCAAMDMVHIKEFKARESIAYADAFTDEVFHRLEKQILPFPNSGQIVLEYGQDDINEIIVHGHRVIFYVLPAEIRVLTVIHASYPLPKNPPNAG